MDSKIWNEREETLLAVSLHSCVSGGWLFKASLSLSSYTATQSWFVMAAWCWLGGSTLRKDRSDADHYGFECTHIRTQDSTLWLDYCTFPLLWKHTLSYMLSWARTGELSLPQCQGKPARLHSASPVIVPSTTHYISGCYLWLLCCIFKCCLWHVNTYILAKRPHDYTFTSGYGQYQVY